MARIRTIKPEFWVSEQLAECSTSARLTFIGIWTFSDDRGVHPAKPKTLKAELFPMDDVAISDVAGWVEELLKVGLLRVFEADGTGYWQVTGWRHQKIDKPSFKYPAPPEFDEASPKARRAFDEAEPGPSRAPPPGVEGRGEESKGKESKGEEVATSPKARRARPTPMPPGFVLSDRVREWAADKGYVTGLEASFENFVEKAKAKGYVYVDWDYAAMSAIRKDWDGIREAARVRHRSAGRADQMLN